MPAFVFLRYGGNLAPEEKIVSYNSLAEFLVGRPEDPAQAYSASYYKAVKLWFMNGGGRCYLVDIDGLDEIKKYSDITLLVSSGANNSGYSILEPFNQLLQDGVNIFGLFDGPEERIKADGTQDDVMSNVPDSSYAASFYPYVLASWTTDVIPPSAVAAVAIALTDRTRGVWKAPANVVINGITPQYPVSDALQSRFSQGKALNMIRSFPNTGTVVWGARTLEDSDNWRYIPVRRLFNMVEKDIQKALNKLVFEPNSQPTWQRVKAAVNNYLHALWQQGALAGNKEEDAWFVQIGKDITMTEDDINQGKMIVKIGLAAVRPAEFILLQFSQNIAQ